MDVPIEEERASAQCSNRDHEQEYFTIAIELLLLLIGFFKKALLGMSSKVNAKPPLLVEHDTHINIYFINTHNPAHFKPFQSFLDMRRHKDLP